MATGSFKNISTTSKSTAGTFKSTGTTGTFKTLEQIKASQEKQKKKNANTSLMRLGRGVYEFGKEEKSVGRTVTKNNGGLGGGIKYVGASLAAGVGGIFEGIGDLVGGAVAQLSGDELYAKYLHEKDVVGEWFQEIEDEYNPGAVMDFVGDVGQGIGQSAVMLVPYVGTAAFFGGVIGQGVSSAVQQTGEVGWREYIYGGATGTIEGLLEKYVGAAGKAGKRLLTNKATTSLIKSGVRNGIFKTMLNDATGEFVEEFASAWIDTGLQRLTGVNKDATMTLREAAYAGLVGAVSGATMGGTTYALSAARNTRAGASIRERGNEKTLLNSANAVLKSVEGKSRFRGDDAISSLRGSMNAYAKLADTDKGSARADMLLGEIQAAMAQVQVASQVGERAKVIQNASDEDVARYAKVASQYVGFEVSADMIRNDTDGVATALGVVDFVNGLATDGKAFATEKEFYRLVAQERAVNAESGADFDESRRTQVFKVGEQFAAIVRSEGENGEVSYNFGLGESLNEMQIAQGVSAEQVRALMDRMIGAESAAKQQTADDLTSVQGAAAPTVAEGMAEGAAADPLSAADGGTRTRLGEFPGSSQGELGSPEGRGIQGGVSGAAAGQGVALSGEATNGQGTSQNATEGEKTGSAATEKKARRSVEASEDYSEYDEQITFGDVQKIHRIHEQYGEISVKQLSSEQLKLVQKWAHKFYVELGVKSPFFTSWFGEWRAHERSTFVDVLEMEHRDGKNPRGQYKNKDTGLIINSSSVGYDETISHSGKDKKSVIAMQNIDRIIENAILFDTEISHPGRGKKSIYTAFMHKFYAPISIDGKKYIAKMAVDESYMPGQNDTNKKFYHVRSIEIETASSVGIGESHTPIIEDTVSTISIADLHALVKRFDKDFTAAHDVSEAVLNEDGTPKVFDYKTAEGKTLKVFKNDAGQIKSAETGLDANIGTFDRAEGNIYHAVPSAEDAKQQTSADNESGEFENKNGEFENENAKFEHESAENENDAEARRRARQEQAALAGEAWEMANATREESMTFIEQLRTEARTKRATKALRGFERLSPEIRRRVYAMMESAERHGVSERMQRRLAVLLAHDDGLEIRFDAHIRAKGFYKELSNGAALIVVRPGSDAFLQTLTHEFAHELQNQPGYERIKAMALRAVGMDTSSVTPNGATPSPQGEGSRTSAAYERIRKAVIRDHTAFGDTLSEAEIEDEIVARIVEQQLGNEKFWRKFERHRGLRAAIDFLRDLADRMRHYDTEDARAAAKATQDLADAVWASVQGMAVRSEMGVNARGTSEGRTRYNLDENLGNQLQDWLDGGGKPMGSYNGTYFELGTTPDILIKHGAKSVPVIMSGDCVAKVTGMKGDQAHMISLDEIAKLPSQLNDPILLFRGSYPNSFVALTEIVDKQGNDVVAAIHIHKKQLRTEITKIASLYSKTDDFGNNRIVNYVTKQINDGNLLDASTKKAPNWFTIRGLQLPKMVQTILDANNSIAQNSKKSTPKAQHSVEKSAKTAKEDKLQARLDKKTEENRALKEEIKHLEKENVKKERAFRNAKFLAEMVTKRDYIAGSMLENEDMKAAIKPLTKIKSVYQLKKNGGEIRRIVRDFGVSFYNTQNDMFAQEGSKADTDGEKWIIKPGILEDIALLARNAESDAELTLEEFEAVDRILREAAHIYREYGTAVVGGRRVVVKQIAKETYEDLQLSHASISGEVKSGALGWMRKMGDVVKKVYTYQILDPRSVIRAMEGYSSKGMFSRLFDDIRMGEVNAKVTLIDLVKPLEDFLKEHKGYEKRLRTGKIVFDGHEMSVGQAISLYELSKREQAKEHLRRGGIKWDGADGEVRELGTLTAAQLDDIKRQLTGEDRAYIALVEDFFNRRAKAVKEEADGRILGYTNTVSGHYFPIKVDSTEIAQDISNLSRVMQQQIMTVYNASFNKNTVAGAGNQVAIDNVFDVVYGHARMLANYSQLYLPMSAFSKVYNARVEVGPGMQSTVRKYLERVWKKNGQTNSDGFEKYMVRLFADLQGSRNDKDSIAKMIEWLRGGWFTATLGLNVGTAAKQVTSLPMALAHPDVDMDCFMRAFTLPSGKEMMERMDQYCSLAYAKHYEGGAALALGVMDKMRGIGQKTMFMIEGMDRQLTCRIFCIAQMQVQKDKGYAIGSEQNLKAAGELAMRIMFDTQSGYTTTERSGAMRSTHEIVRAMTMFTSDAMKHFSRIVDAFGEYDACRKRVKKNQSKENVQAWRAAKYNAAKVVGAHAASTVLLVAVTQLFKWLYNKDREEGETLVEDVFKDVISTEIGMLPGVADVVSFFMDGYDVSHFTYDMVNDVLKNAQALSSIAVAAMNGEEVDGRALNEQIRKAVHNVGYLTGFPFKNINTTFYGLLKRLDPSTAYKYNALFYDPRAKDLEEALYTGDIRLATTIYDLLLTDKTGKTQEKAVKVMLQLYNAGYEEIMPRRVPDEITVKGETDDDPDVVVYLKAAQKRRFEEVYGGASEAVVKLISDERFWAIEAEQQADAIRWLYDSYYNEAANAVAGVKKSTLNALLPLCDRELMVISKAAISAIEADVDKHGDTVSGSRKKKVLSYVKSLGVDAQTREVLMYLNGYRGQSLAEALARYANGKGLSEEQLAEIARLLDGEVKKGKIVLK